MIKNLAKVPSLIFQYFYTRLTSNALVQHANYFLEGLAPLERVQVAYSLFGKPAYGEIHSVQLSFRQERLLPMPPS